MTGVQLRPHHERKLRELLFTFDFGTDHYRCELRDHGNLGVSGQLITNGESIRSCGFISRAEATSWAITARDTIVTNWAFRVRAPRVLQVATC